MGRVAVACSWRNRRHILEPAHTGQHEVEEDEVGGRVLHLEERFLATARRQYLVAVTLQVKDHQIADVPLVLHDEHTAGHAGLILPAARFPQLEDPGMLRRQGTARGLREHSGGGLVQRLLGEVERTQWIPIRVAPPRSWCACTACSGVRWMKRMIDGGM